VTARTKFEIYSVEKGCAEFVWSLKFAWKEGDYEDFSIIAGDSKRSLFQQFQQLEMSYYCISKPYYNLKILVLVLVLFLRTDLTIICVKVRLFLHVFKSHLACSHRPAKRPTLVTSFSAVLRATGLKSRNLMWVNYEG
jgi:hypothetical protein